MQCTGFTSSYHQMSFRNSTLLLLGNKITLLPHAAPERIRTGHGSVCHCSPSTFCLFIPLLQFVCNFTLCSIIGSTLPPPSTSSKRGNSRKSFSYAILLCVSLTDVWINMQFNRFWWFESCSLCETVIFNISPNQCNVSIAICLCHLALMHPK